MNEKEIIKNAIDYIHKHNEQIKKDDKYDDYVKTSFLLKILEGNNG